MFLLHLFELVHCHIPTASHYTFTLTHSLLSPMHFITNHLTVPTTPSDVPAQLGLKAMALAWLEVALAFSKPGPSQSPHCRLDLGLAWPRPWLLAGERVGCIGDRRVHTQHHRGKA